MVSKRFFLCTVILLSTQFGYAEYNQYQSVPGAPGSAIPSLQLQPSTLVLSSKGALDNVDFATCELSKVGIGNLGSDIDMISNVGTSGTMSTSFGSTGATLFGTCDLAMPSKPDLSQCFYKASGDVDTGRFDDVVEEMKKGEEIASCQYKRADAAKAAANCFSKQLTAMKQDMLDIKKDLDSNLKNMATYITNVKSLATAEVKKQDTLNGKIQTLEATKTKVETELTALNGSAGASGQGATNTTSLSGLKSRKKEFEGLQKAFTMALRNEPMRRTAACIYGQGSTSSSASVCPIYNRDGSVTYLDPKTCVLTLYRNEIARGIANGGQLTGDVITKANHVSSDFEQKFNTIMRDLTGTESRYGTIDAFINAHQDKLKSLGADAADQLRDELQRCEFDAKNDITNELKDPSTTLGDRNEKIKSTAEALNGDLGSKLQTLDGVYRDAYREIMNGQEPNAAYAGLNCHSAPMTSNAGQTTFQTVDFGVQVGCVEMIGKDLESMLNGTAPPGLASPIPMPLNVPGLDGNPAYCVGLRDCLDGRNGAKQLLAASVQQQKGMEGDGFFKDPTCQQGGACQCPNGQCPGIKQYTRTKNTEIEGAVKFMAGQLKQRMKVAQFQLQHAKDLFERAHIPFPAEPSGTAKDFQCSADPNSDTPSLCQMPDPFEDKMMAMAGFPNLDSAAFTTAQSSADAQIDKFKKEKTDMHQDELAVENKKTACERESKKEGMTAYENRLQKLLDRCSKAGSAIPVNEVAALPSLDNFSSGLEQLKTDIASTCSGASGFKCKSLEADIGTDPKKTCIAQAEDTAKIQAGEHKYRTEESQAAGGLGLLKKTLEGGHTPETGRTPAKATDKP